MMLDTDRPIQPLDMRLVSDLPLRWRIIPCVYNSKCKAVFDQVLSQRNAAIVNLSWQDLALDEHFRLAVSDLIAKHFRWGQPLFVPQDECFVLFEFWRRRVADCMEFECFVLDLESLPGLDIPGDLKLSSMTYGEFLGALSPGRF